MDSLNQVRTALSSAEQLDQSFRFGLEKEAQRVSPDGSLSQQPHPQAFGDKIKHPYVTTDFGETQLELITPPFPRLEQTVGFLEQLSAWSVQRLGSELLWPLTMPPAMHEPAQEIRISRYPDTPEGHKREVYRRGLAERYPITLHSSCSSHLNVSLNGPFWAALLPDVHGEALRHARDERLMGTARNLWRLIPLILYPFGSSPVAGPGYPFMPPDSAVRPASILRTPHGCTVDVQGITLSYNSLAGYLSELRTALSTPVPAYEAIGLERDGEPIQLNANQLQLPAEYYGLIRIKRSAGLDEDMLALIEQEGIGYLELRTFGLNPFAASGVDIRQQQLLFLCVLWSALHDSPTMTAEEWSQLQQTITAAALDGRNPALQIPWRGQAMSVADACQSLVPELEPIAQWLDDVYGGDAYQESIQYYREHLPIDQTISARIMQMMQERGLTHQELGLELAQQYQAELLAVEVEAKRLAEFANLAV